MSDLVVKPIKKSDCDILEDSFVNVFDRLGNCVDTLVDEKKTKMNVVGSVFGFGMSLTKLTLNVAGCAIKNTPKAIVSVAAVKREIVTTIEDEVHNYQKKQKEDALNKKIKLLKAKK
jgi:hypothetical protein